MTFDLDMLVHKVTREVKVISQDLRLRYEKCYFRQWIEVDRNAKGMLGKPASAQFWGNTGGNDTVPLSLWCVEVLRYMQSTAMLYRVSPVAPVDCLSSFLVVDATSGFKTREWEIYIPCNKVTQNNLKHSNIKNSVKNNTVIGCQKRHAHESCLTLVIT